MITHISPREAELIRQIDEQGAQLEAWRDRAIAAEDGIKRHEEMAAMATAEIADLTAELARLRAQEPCAWLTEHDGGPMLWHDYKEACLYCDEGVEPTPLIRGAT